MKFINAFANNGYVHVLIEDEGVYHLIDFNINNSDSNEFNHRVSNSGINPYRGFEISELTFKLYFKEFNNRPIVKSLGIK